MCKIEVSHAYFDNLIISNSTSMRAWSRSNKNGFSRIVIGRKRRRELSFEEISKLFKPCKQVIRKFLSNFTLASGKAIGF